MNDFYHNWDISSLTDQLDQDKSLTLTEQKALAHDFEKLRDFFEQAQKELDQLRTQLDK